MNIPTPADPELLLARECARRFIHARYGYSINRIKLAEMINAGEFDDEREIQSALAAIRATTEAAASWVEQYPSPLSDLPMALAIRDLAQGVRANHHIKGSDDV